MMKCRCTFPCKLAIIHFLVFWVFGASYGQGTISRDTIEYKEHYLLVRCTESEDSDIYYEVSYPGCFTSSISIEREQSFAPPIISFCMPYDNYIEYGRSLFESEDVVVHSFMFENNQFLIIYIDKWAVDKELQVLPSVPSRKELYDFVNSHASRTPLYEPHQWGTPKPLNKHFDTVLNGYADLDTNRKTMVVHKSYCTILLFNVIQDEIAKFVKSAESLMVYEVKRVIPE